MNNSLLEKVDLNNSDKNYDEISINQRKRKMKQLQEQFNEVDKMKKLLEHYQQELKKIDDFTWASVSYFYIGKSYEEMNKEELAIPYFTKVDSIFQKQNFIFPEVRNNYEVLIKHYFKLIC